MGRVVVWCDCGNWKEVVEMDQISLLFEWSPRSQTFTYAWVLINVSGNRRRRWRSGRKLFSIIIIILLLDNHHHALNQEDEGKPQHLSSLV